MFDYVCHPLQCPRCGEISADTRGDLQTKLQEHSTTLVLRVGDRVELRGDLLTGGYLVTHARREPLRVIEEWICDKCGANFLWAVLEIRDGILVSVEPVELDEARLESVDLISGQVLFLFSSVATEELVVLDHATLRTRIAEAAKRRREA